MLYSELKSTILEDINSAVKKAGYSKHIDDQDLERSFTPSKMFGDFSSSIAMKISKLVKKSPQEVASSIGSKISSEYIEKVTTENGFLNIHLDRERFSSAIMEEVIHKGYSNYKTGNKRKTLVEYPSTNPVHPLHLGQLRNAILGDCIANIYTANGYDVEREDYIDDLGLQAAQAFWGSKNLNIKKKASEKFDHYLGGIYVEVNKRIDDTKVKKGIAELLQNMEHYKTDEAKEARELSSTCVKAQYETRFAYKTYHDVLIWESDIIREELLQKALKELMKNPSVKKMNEGDYKDCIVIDQGSIELPKELAGSKEQYKVLIRSDGTATYLAKDIAFHMWKFGIIDLDFEYNEFIKMQPNGVPLYTTSEKGKKKDFGKAKIAINIIDYRQNQEQLLLRLAFKIMGNDEVAENIMHLSYGVVDLESGALSGRKGTWIGNTADDLLEEARKKSEEMIGSRFKMSEKEKKEIAEAVALSAIKFDFLKVSPEKNITFSWKRALSFEGESGPYCQYMCARASRIINDSDIEKKDIEDFEPSELVNDDSFDLVKKISLLQEAVDKACSELRPNVLTDYIIELAYSFSRFYENVPVLKAEEKQKLARLALVYAFKETISYALKLLGIDPIEKM